jgi:hypothetical protein
MELPLKDVRFCDATAGALGRRVLLSMTGHGAGIYAGKVSVHVCSMSIASMEVNIAE